jgi:hypothetical protein
VSHHRLLGPAVALEGGQHTAPELGEQRQQGLVERHRELLGH